MLTKGVNTTDYYPGGMTMPNRKTVGGELYRYGYQGEFAETDPETGKVAFQLRLYDPRINRWLTTDPAGQYHSPYMAMGNNWINQVDPDGAKGEDWYEILDANGKGTGEYEWFEGSFDIKGYEHLGFDFVISNTDINNNTTTIKYDGATKSSYLYNRETAKYDFIKNYDNTSFVSDFLLGYINSPLKAGQQFSKSLIVGFQGAGILLYEGLKGTNIDGGGDILNLGKGYKPVMDIEDTLMLNNGKWVHINLHSQGGQKFMETYARDIYGTQSTINLPKNINKAWSWLNKK